MTNWKQWRGLKSLVVDAVEQGSKAIERVQRESANRPFSVLERIESIGEPTRGIHALYDAGVGATHEILRGVNRAVGQTLDVALDFAERNEPVSKRDGSKGGS